jgi:hypothetical protein
MYLDRRIRITCLFIDKLRSSEGSLVGNYEWHSKHVFETDYLQIDESSIKVLEDNNPESSHQGYM